MPIADDDQRPAAAIGGELAILRYAFLSWRDAPDVPPGTQPLHARKSGAVAALAALAAATVVEMLAVHLLVRTASVRAAWIVTGVSLLSLVWLVGFIRAFVLLPSLLDARTLRLRVGLLRSMEIPLDAIARVETGRGKAPVKGTPGYARLSLLAQPNVVLTLRAPCAVRGLYGSHTTATVVGFFADEPALVARAMSP